MTIVKGLHKKIGAGRPMTSQVSTTAHSQECFRLSIPSYPDSDHSGCTLQSVWRRRLVFNVGLH